MDRASVHEPRAQERTHQRHSASIASDLDHEHTYCEGDPEAKGANDEWLGTLDVNADKVEAAYAEAYQ